MINIVIKNIIAILLESNLLDNKEQARLEMHYDFNQEDIRKDIESYFTTEIESTSSKHRLRDNYIQTYRRSRHFADQLLVNNT